MSIPHAVRMVIELGAVCAEANVNDLPRVILAFDTKQDRIRFMAEIARQMTPVPAPGRAQSDRRGAVPDQRHRVRGETVKDKIEITDAMVERFLKKSPMYGDRDSFEYVRDGLNAALNPPEPEVTVTKEMLEAGARAYNGYTYGHHNAVTVPLTFGALTDAFRAMRALEPGSRQTVVVGGQTLGGRGKRRIHARDGDSDYHTHRRAGDPR